MLNQALEIDTGTADEKRLISIGRAVELKGRISDYLECRDSIKTGIDLQEEIDSNRRRILDYFNAGEKDWDDWNWQLSRRINKVESLAGLFDLTREQCESIDRVGMRFRWAISPYYAALITGTGSIDPIWMQSVPSQEEMADTGHQDPMAEEYTSPAPCITRRYPDRLIINVTNQCSMYCRHCQRRRNIGEVDSHRQHHDMVQALEYIHKNREIRDVLITGGDALLLSDPKIDWLLGELDRIDHVEIKRLGTRAIVTMPQRITPNLCAVLKKHPPVYINTQFNHPREITQQSKRACDMLVEAGVVLGNQSVLLKGINNDPNIFKRLNQELLKIRVRPYYIFQAKPVKGTCHFITPVREGINIMENLRGFTSGLAVPTYVINAPQGLGKTPVAPRYVMGFEDGDVLMRTWENRVVSYEVSPAGD